MGSKKSKVILPIVMTMLFAIFFIPITLFSIIISRFFKKKIQQLYQRYGYGAVLYTITNSNIKGLVNLIIRDYKQEGTTEV